MSTTFVRYGYLAVFAGVMLEHAGLPMPGETILLAAGFLAFAGHFALPVVIGVGVLGAVLGDHLGYLMGRHFGRLCGERYGRYVLLSPPTLTPLEPFLVRHGAKSDLIVRCMAGLRVFAPFLAGLSSMPWGTFCLYTAPGAMLWAVTVAVLGYGCGQTWGVLARGMGRLGVGVIAGVMGLGCMALLRHAGRLKEVGAFHLAVYTVQQGMQVTGRTAAVGTAKGHS